MASKATTAVKAAPAADVSERARELAADIPQRARELFVLVGYLRSLERAGIEPGNSLDDATNELCDLAVKYVCGELSD